MNNEHLNYSMNRWNKKIKNTINHLMQKKDEFHSR